MPKSHQSRKLPRNREYPGYQFYCTIHDKSANAEHGFCHAVLCVIDWLKERLHSADVTIQEIEPLPDQDHASEIHPSDFKSFSYSSGFTLSAVSLPDQGIWTMRLKEPDSDTNTRKAIIGRFFTTDVGLHRKKNGQTELGVRILVTDPENAEEVDFAFRPKFVRYLFGAQDLTLTHVIDLPYLTALNIETEEQLKELRTLLDSSRRDMPVILVTQSFRLPKPENLLFPGGLPSRSLFPASGQASTSPAVPPPEYFYPIDADEIALHNFGYAITFRMTENLHSILAKRLKKPYVPGDILFAEPKCFGGNVSNLGQEEGTDVNVYDLAHCYSKHRSYDFGEVCFEYDAQLLAHRSEIDRIRSSRMVDEEKLDRLYREIDTLQSELSRKNQKIDELKLQVADEYKRGQQSEKSRADMLQTEKEKLQKMHYEDSARIQTLETDNREARGFRQAVEAIRSLSELPQTGAEVVTYFCNIFSERLDFTDRGRRTAEKCGIRPDALWYYLYQMATALYDLYLEDGTDIEKAFLEATGIELALTEGSMSHKDNRIMNHRRDTYLGKEVFTEAHMKLSAQRTGFEHQRIYYCFDRETQKLIIGSVGEHMKTAGSTRR